jgi:hypothetical protein
MAPAGHELLWDAIGRLDARMRVLSNFGIDLSRPGVLERMRARAGEMRRQQAELEETQREADRWLPEMLDFYRNGSDADRQQMRDFLFAHRSFRWGFGWGLIDRIATADDARNVLAVFSMKDGDIDWRDRIVAHDHLCASMRRAGLPVAALLTEAAGWSSDTPRFAPARSTRAMLLDYAKRFAG